MHLKRILLRMMQPFQCMSCNAEHSKEERPRKRLPRFCIGHVAMVMAVLYILVMELLR